MKPSEVCLEICRGMGAAASRRASRLLPTLLALVAMWLVAGVAPLSAQTTSGRISGTVLDASQAPIKDVTVTVINQATGLTKTATTDQTGVYVFVSLPRGTYTVSAEVNGFKK